MFNISKYVRLVAPQPIKLGNVILGGKQPVICTPIVGATVEKMVESIRKAVDLGVDMLELRIDSLNTRNRYILGHLVREIRKLSDIPIIVTNRPKEEGGFKLQKEEGRINAFIDAITIGEVDLLDIELSTRPEMRDHVVKSAKDHGIYVIISYHDFESTPDKETLLKIVAEERKYGADIVKFMTMPKTHMDVLTQLQALLETRSKLVKCPIISASMGALGTYSRIVGLLLGSDVVFACLPEQPSAPGQLTIEEIKTILKILNLREE